MKLLTVPLKYDQALSFSHQCTNITISNNLDKCTHMSLDSHFINTVRNSTKFQPLKDHLQKV